MKLGFEKIKEITLGAVRISENEDGIRFFRFTEEQQACYGEISPNDFYKKTFSPAGVRLSFRTDSKKMFLRINAIRATGRTYFSLDVYVNGKSCGKICNYGGFDLSGDYTTIDAPLGEFSSDFELGEGMKEVTVYLPWSVAITLSEMSLDDGAFIEPIRPNKKIIVYGDSITHGYDALSSAERYPVKLADALGAEEINKAIGGAVFEPKLAACKDPFEPDYVSVAYGTNDWSKFEKDKYFENCREFYAALSKNYPNAKIFALAPIWRKDCYEIRTFGSFFDIEGTIKEAISPFSNVIFISCFDFVPKDEKMFADLRLHPNDEGFFHYANNLINKIKEYV